jgi:signal transduction histidine kinase
LTGTDLSRLVEAQAALRRVATLVAQGRPQQEVFAVVLEEVVRMLGVDMAIMGRYGPDATLTSVARSGGPSKHLPVGSRWKLGGNNLGTIVFDTGRPARIDGYADTSSGPLGGAVQEAGIRSSVAAPITVEGRLWGLIAAARILEQPLPPEAESRLSDFTELVAAAIANADSRAELAGLAEQQAALRRVATLVAKGTAPEDVFAAVVEEVGRLLPVDLANLCRYEPDRTQTFIATWGRPGKRFPLGSQWPLGGKNLATIVYEGGCTARVEDYVDASGPVNELARKVELRSAVGTPIFVEGRVWGMIGVGSSQKEPLPADTEVRLASFTELVATAIANAESRAAIAQLAAEQAALRRVATLVAQGVAPEHLFVVVAEEIERLLPVDFAHLARYESNGTFTILAVAGSTTATIRDGSSFRLDGENLGTLVLASGRPARIDNYANNSSGAPAAAARDAGIHSAAGMPIVVEGRIWGFMTVGMTHEPSLPQDIEARLGSFTELVAMAMANAEGHAALVASRARIVAAADESRRRIERDLHDGAQQRLVHAVILLKLALQGLARADANAHELVTQALRHAEQANAELRELAHGILPAALTRGGLRAGVEALVSRLSVPVDVNVPASRFQSGVEATAYFVVSEALTNVAKHAQASTAAVTAEAVDGHLRVEVRDDGIGGARGGPSTGLGGLEDRVIALNGRLLIESRPGEGTCVSAWLPVSGTV